MIIIDVIMEFFHGYVDFWVRPFKILFPNYVWFWRPDNKPPYIKKVYKEWGYWIGHLIAYICIAYFIWHGITHIENIPFMSEDY